MVRALLVWPMLAGCDVDPCARGAMVESPGGLVVTRAEHPTGWRSATCTDCHALDALHLDACTPDVDLVEAQEEVDAHGIQSCASCHGENGVAR